MAYTMQRLSTVIKEYEFVFDTEEERDEWFGEAQVFAFEDHEVYKTWKSCFSKVTYGDKEWDTSKMMWMVCTPNAYRRFATRMGEEI